MKAGLLGLVDEARGQGWSQAGACRILKLNPDRATRWRRRQRRAGLADARPGPTEALHQILPWERQAIIELFDEWGEIDRSHRKLAHRGSRLERVFVSESTVFRVLTSENLVLPATPSREPVGPRKPWPDWVEYRPCQVWAHDLTAFRRAGRDVLAILDLVSRKWIATLVVPAGRGESEHVQAVYTRALEAEGLLAEIEARMVAPNTDELMPVLLAVSDGGPQMVSGTARDQGPPLVGSPRGTTRDTHRPGPHRIPLRTHKR
ncbi:MAG: hypothetical protein ACE5F5_12955 [Acidimicrobiia bacterium]